MKLRAESVGSYPRIGDTPRLQRYRRAVQDHQAGKISDAQRREAGLEMVRRALQEQAEAGLDRLTDGLIFWDDPVSHLVRGLSGVGITDLVRFYDTNTYFRRPRITALPERRGPILLEDYRDAARLSPRPVKVVLTGPVTLTRLSLLDGPDERAVCERLTRILADEIADLRGAGAQIFQIDEPELTRRPADAERVNGALAAFGEAGVHVSFGDAAPVLDALLDGPAAWIGLDLSYGPGLLERLPPRRKPILFGCVDARTTRREDPDRVAAALRGVARDGDAVGPSTGLEYLPRDRAQEKLRVVARVRERI
jgi:5-methyltetrahydropteroyltriglutamate--homocysteine methyltransferase